MVEAASRSVADGSEYIFDDNGGVEAAYYTGFGANVQTGYVFKSNWELSGRYAFTKPNKTAYNKEITDYTLGISKYIIGNNFKIQGDVTYREMPASQDEVITRLQVEFQF